jgi:hypothetical protein
MEAAMNPKVIVIDGKTYHSVNEMPPEVRQKYEEAMRSLGDANKNQIPDALESVSILADADKDGVPDVLENIVPGHAFMNSVKIIVDGQEFNSIEDLPPEARARYEEAMGKLDANRNGIPDFVEGMIDTGNQNMMSVSTTTAEAPRRSTPLPVNSTITPDTSSGWLLVLSGLFIFLLCVAGAAGVWYFFLR